MTDRLDRAFRALRESADGHDPRAEETLARILRQAEPSPARGGRRALRVWLLAAAVVAVSTAAAARSGQLGRVLRLVAWRDDVPAAAPAGDPASPVAGTPAPLPTPPGPSPLEPLDPSPAGEPAPAVPSESAAIENAPGVVPSPAPPADLPSRPFSAAAGRHESIATSTRTAQAAPAKTAAPAPNTTPSASAAAAADDQAFAHAHALHFHGADPVAALAAWDEYLRDFPSGRFAPEARYNRAIDLLKLGRNGEARDALQPFADGAFDGYRRDEAQGILRSLAKDPR
jgi:hypothetical protein